MILINVTGGNAIGKTTRTTCLYHYLMKHFEYENVQFDNVIIGKLFKKTDLFLLGKWNNSKQQWVGLDIFRNLKKLQIRIDVMKYVFEKYKPKYYFQEGYFNNQSPGQMNLENLNFLDNIWHIFFLYKNIEEFIEQKFYKQGKMYNVLEIKNSSAWEKNQYMWKMVKLMQQNKEKYGKVIVLEKDEPKDYFVNLFFNTRYNCESKKLNKIFLRSQ